MFIFYIVHKILVRYSIFYFIYNRIVYIKIHTLSTITLTFRRNATQYNLFKRIKLNKHMNAT